jgi:hypothetical protein
VGEVVLPTEAKEEKGIAMLNCKVLNVQIFNSRIAVSASANMGSHEIQKSYYNDTAKDPTADDVNASVLAATSKIKEDLFAHLSGLAESSDYQKWTTILAIAEKVPAADAVVSPAPVVAPVAAVIAAPVVVATAPVAVPVVVATAPVAPVVEAAPAPVAKPALKALKPAAPKPVAAPVIVAVEEVYTKGVAAHGAALKGEMTAMFGAEWMGSKDHIDFCQAAAAAMIEQRVVVIRDGEITSEFKAFFKSFAE